jgi:two-component sensor histidine kinase
MAGFDTFYELDSSINILSRCLEDLKESSCPNIIRLNILQNLAVINRYAGNYEDALANCELILKEFGKVKKARFRALNAMGAIYSFQGEVDKATITFLEAFDIANELESSNRSVLLNNICTVYNDNGFPQKAKEYCMRSRRLALKDDFMYAYGLSTNTLACIYNDLNKRDSARIFIAEALKIELPLAARHYSYLELGRIEENDNNYELSSKSYKKAVDIAVQLGYPFEEAFARSNLSNVMIYQKNYQEAVIESEKSIKIYNGLESTPQELVDVYERYIAALAGAEQKIPLSIIDKYTYLTDTVFSENKKALLVEIEEKYQNEKLKADKVQADLKLNQQKYTILAGGMLLLMLGIFSYLLFRQSQKRLNLALDLEKSKDHITLLNQELNHRVKNNLAFITTLMQMQSRRATQLETKELLKDSENRLLALSKVHRNLKQGDNSSIRIEQYLSDIMDNLQSAFQSDYKKMTLDKDIKNLEIDAESTMRIGLIINELITNSMKHIDKPEVNIKISLNQSDNDKITLRYQDNGSGIERLLNSNKSKDSMGLHLIDILRKQLRGKVDIVLV